MSEFLRGVDISTLPMLERAGARYFDESGRARELLSLLKESGVNAVRIRAWVDPCDEKGRGYGAGGCDTACAASLAARAKALGMKTLLCLHYSDFWADPGKQFLPKQWRKLSENALAQAVYDYTDAVINAVPADMVQVGNEITNGLLFPHGQYPNFERIAAYTRAGAEAVRAHGDIPVLIHIDRGGDADTCEKWFDRYFKHYDRIDGIGLSYYPFWHGALSALEETLDLIARKYHLPAYVVETAYPRGVDDDPSREKLPLGATMNKRGAWAMSPCGQRLFLGDLIAALRRHDNARGFFWWEPAWLPIIGCGWAVAPALDYLNMPSDTPLNNEWALNTLFDADGRALEGLKAFNTEGSP